MYSSPRFPIITALFIALLSDADVVVYNGNSRLERSGTQSNQQLKAKTFVLVDLNTWEIVRFNYFPASSGLRVYTTEFIGELQTNCLALSKTRTATVLANAKQITNDNSQISIAATFLKGQNFRLTIYPRTNLFISFPARPNWSRKTIVHSDDGANVYSEETGTLNFDATRTRSYNSNRNSFLDSVNAVASGLESRGYVRTIFP